MLCMLRLDIAYLRNNLPQYGVIMVILLISWVTNLNAVDYQINMSNVTPLLKATHVCRDLGRSWSLPNGNANWPQINNIMEDKNISSIWLGIKRVRHEWRWLDGRNHANVSVTDDGHACGMLKFDHHLTSSSCSDQSNGFICDLPAEKLCPEQYLNQACFILGNHWSIIGCKSPSWYHARSYCQKQGADLANMSDKSKRKLLEQYLHDSGLVTKCHWFHVGVQRETWENINSKGDFSPLDGISNMWDIGEPSDLTYNFDCVVFQKGKWKTRKCSSAANVLCQKTHSGSKEVAVVYFYQNQFPNEFKAVEIGSSVTGPVVASIILGVVLALVISGWLIREQKDLICKKAMTICTKKFTPRSYNLHIPKDKSIYTVVITCSQLTVLPKDNKIYEPKPLFQRERNIKKINKEESKVIKSFLDECKSKDRNVQIVCLRVPKMRLSIAETNTIISFLEVNSTKIDLFCAPCMKLDEKSLPKLISLRDKMVILTLALDEGGESMAMETIAVGITKEKFRAKASKMISGCLVDITRNLSGYVDVEALPNDHLVCVAGYVATESQEKNSVKSFITDTGAAREFLIKAAGEIDKGYHPRRGFGEIPPSKDGTAWPKVQRKKLGDQKIRIIIASTGVNKNEQLEDWTINHLEPDREDDEDPTYNWGTRAAECYIRYLNGVSKNAVEIIDAHMAPPTVNVADWERYEKLLRKFLTEEPDIIVLPTMLGRPGYHTPIYDLLENLKQVSVLLTSTMPPSSSSNQPDFPSQSVISVRYDAEGEDNWWHARGATVDFCVKAPKGEKIESFHPICGAYATAGLVTRILLHAKTENIELFKDLRSTSLMNAVLRLLSQSDDTNDGTRILNPHTYLPVLSEIVEKAREFTSWTGKYIAPARSSKS